MQKFCIVGLGNPGTTYKFTRHNVGFSFLDFLSRTLDFSWERRKNYEFSNLQLNGVLVVFLKPMQFMNLSGHAVREITQFYKIEQDHILICYDDLAFQIGDFRLKPQGSSGGHNGLHSVIQQMGSSKIARLRFGISPSEGGHSASQKNYVLSRFTDSEQAVLTQLFSQCQKVIEIFLQEGIDKAMLFANSK